MGSSNISKIKQYFKEKAPEYDLVDEQIYWVLSDKLLWTIFEEQVLSAIVGPIKFIDAGAGTGRWAIKILKKYLNSSGLLIDLSPDMLEQAETKLKTVGLIDRVKIQCANLDTASLERDINYNLAFSFHNVLGFVENPQNVVNKLSQLLCTDGYLVCVVPNYFHNIFFNLSVNNVDLALKCYNERIGKFTEDMPDMHMFVPSELIKIYENAGIKVLGVYGFPLTIFPGMQETQIKGQSAILQSILSNTNNFEKIFNIESHLYKCSEAAARGNNLIIVGKK